MRPEIALNGPSATSATNDFTSRSATARLAHNGPDGPSPIRLTWAFAQDTSFEGSRKDSPAEKAMPKNGNVSTTEPMADDASEAFHHAPPRSLSNTATSNSCAVSAAGRSGRRPARAVEHRDIQQLRRKERRA